LLTATPLATDVVVDGHTLLTNMFNNKEVLTHTTHTPTLLVEEHQEAVPSVLAMLLLKLLDTKPSLVKLESTNNCPLLVQSQFALMLQAGNTIKVVS